MQGNTLIHDMYILYILNHIYYIHYIHCKLRIKETKSAQIVNHFLGELNKLRYSSHILDVLQPSVRLHLMPPLDATSRGSVAASVQPQPQPSSERRTSSRA